MVSASIIVCTHNRAHLLRRALEPAASQARECGAEVLVVDNASTDDTPTVVGALARDLAPTLRTAHEPRLGLSAARNCGLAHARGALAVFLDDDAVPRPGWLPALLAPFAAPGIVCVGGRILLEFFVPPPPWLTPPLHPALSAFDLGDEPRRVPERPGDQYPCGANIAFRTATVRALGGFATRMGLRGASGLQQEETDLCWRIDRSGGEIRYAPDAVVDHWVFPERLSPEWFFARFALFGKSNAIFELKNGGLHRALGLLRWHYVPRLSLRRYRPAASVDADRLLAECRRREALGYLRGLAAGIPRLPALRRERVLSVAS